MNKMLFAIILLACHNSQALVYVSPLNPGILSTASVTGDNNLRSYLSVGGEAYYFRSRLFLGLKYDHIDFNGDPEKFINVQTRLNLVFAEAGVRILDASISPYLFAGGGLILQSIQTKAGATQDDNSSAVFGYKFGFGTIAQITDNWAANLSVHYYPQTIIDGLNYMLSIGYIF